MMWHEIGVRLVRAVANGGENPPIVEAIAAPEGVARLE
jgi:hypothetical protein